MSIFDRFKVFFRDLFGDSPESKPDTGPFTPPPVAAIPPAGVILSEPPPPIDDGLAALQLRAQELAATQLRNEEALAAEAERNAIAETPQQRINRILGRNELPVTIVEGREPVNDWTSRVVDVGSQQSGGGSIPIGTLTEKDWAYLLASGDNSLEAKIAGDRTMIKNRIQEKFEQFKGSYPAEFGSIIDYRGAFRK